MTACGRRRVLLTLSLVAAVLALVACGSDSSSLNASTATSRAEHPQEGPKPTLHYPSRPPKHVVVRVIKEGSGARLRPGDQVAALFVGGNPKTKLFQDFWSPDDPYKFKLGGNTLGRAWEIGLSEMRVGGRRELVVPSRLAYGDGMMVFVIEPLEVEKRAP